MILKSEKWSCEKDTGIPDSQGYLVCLGEGRNIQFSGLLALQSVQKPADCPLRPKQLLTESLPRLYKIIFSMSFLLPNIQLTFSSCTCVFHSSFLKIRLSFEYMNEPFCLSVCLSKSTSHHHSFKHFCDLSETPSSQIFFGNLFW